MKQILLPSARVQPGARRTAGWRCAVVVLCLGLLGPAVSVARVQALFQPDVLEQAPFPSNRFTVPNLTNRTHRQVNLPFPDCVAQPSDCNNLRAYPTISLLIQIWIVATVRNASKHAAMRSHRTTKRRYFFWNQANVRSA